MAPPLLPRELVYLSLDELDPDQTFRLREPGEISSLAQSIAQLGQLFPVEVRLRDGRYQLVTGFRRLEALRMLMRKRILARVHAELSEEEAALLAAADAIDSRPLELEELRALEALYRQRDWITPALQELIGRGIEKAEERIEDIEAALRGEPPPDRSVVDEDAAPLEQEPLHVSELRPGDLRPAEVLPIEEGRASPPPSRPPEPAPLGGGEGPPGEAARLLAASLGDLNAKLSSLLAQGGPVSAAHLARLSREAASCRALAQRITSKTAEPEAPRITMEKTS